MEFLKKQRRERSNSGKNFGKAGEEVEVANTCISCYTAMHTPTYLCVAMTTDTLPPGHKKCSCCNEVKPVTDFGANCQTTDGLMYYCRTCNSEKQREYRRRNPEKAKASRLRYLERVRSRNRSSP